MLKKLDQIEFVDRVCLKCDKPFPSEGPANRICPVCARINTKLGHIPEEVLARQRGVKRLNGRILDDVGQEF